MCCRSAHTFLKQFATCERFAVVESPGRSKRLYTQWGCGSKQCPVLEHRMGHPIAQPLRVSRLHIYVSVDIDIFYVLYRYIL